MTYNQYRSTINPDHASLYREKQKIDVRLTEPQLKFLTLPPKYKYPLFVAGYGSGKSECLIWGALRDALGHKGTKVGVYSPTYDLLRLNLIPRMEEKLIQFSIPYTYNKSENIIRLTEYDSQIIFRSLDNPSRIISYETATSHIDELDIVTPLDKADLLWKRILARTRQPRPNLPNQLFVYTTPEGFHFTYKKWKKEPKEGFFYIKAPTYSNPFLPEEYVNELYRNYPPELCKAYIEGEWVNLFSGNVFSYFDRNTHHTDLTPDEREPIYISQDFNIGGCVSIVYIFRRNSEGKKIPIAVDEFESYDTQQLIENIRSRYPRRIITIYPDSTGRKRTTNASYSDIQLLREAKFRIRAKSQNPPIKDRINAMNNLLSKNQYLINTTKCPRLTESLEQHAWDHKTGLPEKHPEPGSIDDYTDAATYLIAYEFPIQPLATLQRLKES